MFSTKRFSDFTYCVCTRGRVCVCDSVCVCVCGMCIHCIFRHCQKPFPLPVVVWPTVTSPRVWEGPRALKITPIMGWMPVNFKDWGNILSPTCTCSIDFRHDTELISQSDIPHMALSHGLFFLDLTLHFSLQFAKSGRLPFQRKRPQSCYRISKTWRARITYCVLQAIWIFLQYITWKLICFICAHW